MTRRRASIAAGFVVAAALALFLSQRDSSVSVSSIERDAWHQSPALLEKAWALPVASTYRAGYDVQRNASFCGPTSVVNVERSLGARSDQSIVLEGTGVSTLFGFVPGLTLDELARVTERRTRRTVTILRGLDLPTLRAQLTKANDPSVRFIANFHRGPLFGRGRPPLTDRRVSRRRRSRLRARRQRLVSTVAGAPRATARGDEHGRFVDRSSARAAAHRDSRTVTTARTTTSPRQLNASE